MRFDVYYIERAFYINFDERKLSSLNVCTVENDGLRVQYRTFLVHRVLTSRMGVGAGR